MVPNIVKGTRVQAQWFQATDACLAGMQPKTGAIQHNVIGVVTHIRGDHPTQPKIIRVWVKPDVGGDEVIIDPAHIIAIL